MMVCPGLQFFPEQSQVPVSPLFVKRAMKRACFSMRDQECPDAPRRGRQPWPSPAQLPKTWQVTDMLPPMPVGAPCGARGDSRHAANRPLRFDCALAGNVKPAIDGIEPNEVTCTLSW